MRGRSEDQTSMLCLVSPDSMIPKGHPIRAIKVLADEGLRSLSPVFDEMYSSCGRPSIPPERLLKASLLMALFSVRSERSFCEQLSFNLMFKFFLDMDLMEGTFDASSFAKNRERLLKHDVAGLFFASVVMQAKGQGLISEEHFSVDGTLIEAWASLKSFKRKDGSSPKNDDDDKGNPNVNFRGEKRKNATHQSSTDPEAKLARKSDGTTAKLCFAGHGLMENRNGLLVNLSVTEAHGTSERDAALDMLAESMLDGTISSRRPTLGGDKGYDTRGFVKDVRAIGATPHVAANHARTGGSAIDERTMRHAGYAVSQRLRKRIEEIWGWMKTVGCLRKTRYKGVERVRMHALLTGAAYNLVRMSKLLAAG